MSAKGGYGIDTGVPGPAPDHNVMYRPRRNSDVGAEVLPEGNDQPPAYPPGQSTPQTPMSPMQHAAPHVQFQHAAQNMLQQQHMRQQQAILQQQAMLQQQMQRPPAYTAGQVVMAPQQFNPVQSQQFNPVHPQIQVQTVQPQVQVVTTGAPNGNYASYKLQCIMSCAMCTAWKGILEIVARSLTIVLAVLLIGDSIAIISTINSTEHLTTAERAHPSVDRGTGFLTDLQDLIARTRSVSAFMIFVAVLVFLVEIPIIVGRFTLRPGIGLLRILHVLDAIGSVILALFLLSGAAPSASYSSQWGEPPTLCDESISSSALTCNDIRLTGLMGGLAFLGFIGLGLVIFLTVWTIIAAVTKWDYVNTDETNKE